MTVVLYHSAYGLLPGVRAAAEILRSAGYEIVLPDLYDGRTAQTVTEGMRIKDEIGTDELLRRAVAAAAPSSDRGLVYAGFSLGASLAQNVALADERARGLLLLHGTSDIADGTVAAATGLPVQLHVADPDPPPAFGRAVPPETHDWLNAWYLRMRRAGTETEVFRYPGAGHIFSDPDLEDYDREAAERMWEVALGFLGELGDPPAA